MKANRSAMARELEKQLEFYIANQSKFLKKYENKILLIHSEKLIAAFDSRGEAYRYGLNHFEPGTFFLIKCTPGDRDYSVNQRSVYRFSRLSLI